MLEPENSSRTLSSLSPGSLCSLRSSLIFLKLFPEMLSVLRPAFCSRQPSRVWSVLPSARCSKGPALPAARTSPGRPRSLSDSKTSSASGGSGRPPVLLSVLSVSRWLAAYLFGFRTGSAERCLETGSASQFPGCGSCSRSGPGSSDSGARPGPASRRFDTESARDSRG